MNSWLLLSLFTAHLVGDFYCQNDKLCRQKEAFKIKSRFLYAHSLIIGILSWIMVPQTGFIIYAFVIAAKSILRFKDSDTDRTEYVLVGTLLSFGIAIAVGLITVKIKM